MNLFLMNVYTEARYPDGSSAFKFNDLRKKTQEAKIASCVNRTAVLFD